MFKELIDKLKLRKLWLENYKHNKTVIQSDEINENKNIVINVTNEYDFYKIEIPYYISLEDYVNKMESGDEYNILDSLCNCVIYNSEKKKVNKGIYYVITNGNSLYNILLNDEKIKISERIKLAIDEDTGKENITQERVITFYTNNNEYNYFSAKHDSSRDTYYTKYYNKNRGYSLGELDLNVKDTLEEISSVIYNMENINEVEKILDINILKLYILDDLKNECIQKKKHP